MTYKAKTLILNKATNEGIPITFSADLGNEENITVNIKLIKAKESQTVREIELQIWKRLETLAREIQEIAG